MHANFVFRRHLGKHFWKIISKVNLKNFVTSLDGYIAPKLQERCVRVMLAKNMSF
jgi:hypothetical protein